MVKPKLETIISVTGKEILSTLFLAVVRELEVGPKIAKLNLLFYSLFMQSNHDKNSLFLFHNQLPDTDK